jgi:hypothetical protein
MLESLTARVPGFFVYLDVGVTADPYSTRAMRLATDGQSLSRVALLCLDIRPTFKIAFNKIRRLS